MDLMQNMLPGAQCSLDLPEDLPPSSFDMDLVPGSIKGAMKGLYAGIPEISVSPAPVPPRAHPGR